MTRDASLLEQKVAELAEREAQLRSVLESAAEGIFGVDAGGTCTFANPAAVRILGGELLGQDMRPRIVMLDEVLAVGLARRGDDGRLKRADGTVFPARWSVSPVRAGDTVTGAVVTFEDITDRKRDERVLAEARIMSDSALTAGSVGTYFWDIAVDRVYGDVSFSALFGIPVDATGAAPIGNFLAVIHPEDLPTVKAKIEKVLADDSPYEAEYRIVSGGREIWVVARGRVERDHAGTPVRFLGILMDIHDRKRAQAEYRRVVEASGAGFWDLVASTGAINADARLVELMGLPPGGAVTLASALDGITFPAERAAVAEAVAAALRGEHGGSYAMEFRTGGRGDIPLRWVESRGETTFGADGKAVRLAGVMIDATARKNAELEREHARSQVAEVLEQMNEAFFAMTPDWRITQVNRRYEELTGKSRGEVLGKVIWDLFPSTADTSNQFWVQYHRCMDERVPTEFVERYIPLDIWTDVHAYPTSDGGMWAFFRDVTAQRHAEAALQLSEERYRSLFASIDDAFCLIELILDADGKTVDYRFLEANKAFAEHTGLENAVGKTILEMVPTISESWFSLYGRVAETGVMARFENHDPALERWFDVYANRVGPAERRHVAIVFKDITARRHAEEERAIFLTREQQARAEAEAERLKQHDLFMQATVAIAILDGPEHVYTFANAPYRKLVNGRDVLGKPLEVALPDLNEMGFDKLLDNVMATGKPFVATEMPIKLEHHKDNELLYLNFTYTPKRDANGAIDGVMATLVDVTEQVLARQQAEQTSRMKDQFLATVSHELRTPLTAMLGWVQMMRSGQLPAERHARALETIERNARAQAQLIEDLLDMSRILAGKLRLDIEPLDVATVVEAAIESIRPTANTKGITLQPVIEWGGMVMADPNRLQQVIWNLLTNAVKFTPKGGRVQVVVHRVDSAVEVLVADTGQGIPAEFVPYVFERFRQAEGGNTRAKGGLGLGLSIVKQLVEMHGGTVAAFSPGDGKGATFTLRLPLSVTHRREVEPAASSRRAAAGSSKITPVPRGELAGLRLIIVDDEDDSREVLTALLEASGATVRQASSPNEARQLFSDERPDVLVSDIGMPGENGYAFIASIRRLPQEQGGNIPAVALTAYARSEDRTEALMAGFTNHVAKPVEPAELVAAIASLARHARMAGTVTN